MKGRAATKERKDHKEASGGVNAVYAKRHPRSVLTYNNQQRPSLHPTQKPLDLVEWLVRSYSNVQDLVLDPFCGSGTTLVAATRALRRAVGCEREEEYCKVVARRLSAELGQ